MAKRRLQVDPGVPDAQIRTTGRMGDTFVSPSGAGSQAAQLASALTKIAPELAHVAGSLYERKNKSDELAGEEKARETIKQLDESRTTYADAVRDGKIPAVSNPWMKQGYYEELGRQYAGRLQSELTLHVQSDEQLKNSIEIGDFRASTSKFEQQWTEQNVPKELQNQAFQVGYGNRRDAIVANMEAGWASQSEQRFTQRSLGMFRDESIQFIQDALDQNRSMEDIAGFLRQTWDDKHALGWDGRATGQTLIDAVADVAIARKDPELMEQLLAVIPGGDGKSSKNTLARTSYAIDKQEQTASAIFSIRRREWDRQERETQQQSKAILTTAAARLEEAQQNGADPDDVVIDDLQTQAISIGDVALSTHIQTMKEAYSNKEYDDDNNLVADFVQKLHRSPAALKQTSLDAALKDKRLSIQTYNNLSNQLEEALKTHGKAKAFLEGDPFHEYGEKVVRSYFGSSPDADTPQVAYVRNQAQRQFSEWYYQQFVAEGAPNAKLQGKERRDAIDAMAQDLARTWVPYDDSFSGTFRLSGKDLDWKSRPVGTPDQVNPTLDELSGFLAGKIHGQPSPTLISLLSVYGVDLKNRKDLEEFLRTQRNFTKKPPTKK